ncbi:MAG: general secretion pathway protein GspG [Candidatus Aminicenantes bacterium RBG_13_59_9]|jgi:general secretion pathway protein G|nr:MAG: general secretion pathway protein GspG [Candidatus Aminicenantes bacterium RBG_13_59_9]
MAGLRQRKKGFTLVEMLVTLTILAILAAAVLPLAKTAVKREKEIELRRNLRIIREALDAYKKLADEKKIELEEEQEGYPPDLETLVKGVEVKAQQSEPQLGGGLDRKPAQTTEAEEKVIKFLRRIPLDPMTGSTDWGLRSYQDEPDSDDWGGENIYDVYSKSPGTALDGTKYKDW